LKAQILAARPGHGSNIEFAKKIRKLYQQKKLVKRYQHVKKEGTVFDISAIEKILPHRHPFLLVDKIIDFRLDDRIVGVKNVTGSEIFFQGHFPGHPVMPGVLILEAMAQTGGILLLNGTDNLDGKLAYLMGVNNAKFRKTVTPGDQLILEVTITNRRSKMFVMKGKAYVDGYIVAEAEMMAAVVDRLDGQSLPAIDDPASKPEAKSGSTQT
jgi:UDP-3-O-[3-hydroxymyristoyl] N-acetylglucosamine deacetylase/3-hydroxyacyl-[acyl-carrier-protein] dehydratase